MIISQIPASRTLPNVSLLSLSMLIAIFDISEESIFFEKENALLRNVLF